jgi:type II secretory pathway pseudopilin PulG
MQTCRSCRSDDIPDGATHCRHCGRRVGPSRAPVIVILVIAGVVVLAGLVSLISYARDQNAKSAARDHARMEIDSLKAVHCTPDIAEDFDSINTHRFENELDSSPLEPDEKEMLRAAFANGMELAGCGFNARNKPKAGYRSKSSPR